MTTYKEDYVNIVNMGEILQKIINSGNLETKEELNKAILIGETVHDLATIFKNKIKWKKQK